MKKGSVITIAVGVVTVLLTLPVFLALPWPKNGAPLAGLGFCLLAEIVLFGGILLQSRLSGGPILRAGGYTLLGIYALASIALSLLLGLLPEKSHRILAVLQAVLAGSALILFLLLFLWDRHVSGKTTQLSATRLPLWDLQRRAERLFIEAKGASFSQALERLREDLRFIDTTVTVSEDELIAQELSELEALMDQSIDHEAIPASISRLSGLTAQRSSAARYLKEGNI